MQREILFRGKRIDNGEWVYGYYYTGFQDDTVAFILDNMFGIVIDVIPKTVGQFTGLCDKNGVKIFEGDKMSIQLPLGGFWGNIKQTKIGFIRYESDYGGFIVEWEYSKNKHHVDLGCDIAFDGEVIGNIHNN